MKIKSSIYLLLGTLYCLLPYVSLGQTVLITTQFRTPYSLSEILHDGLVFVQNYVEQMAHSTKENSMQLLQIIADKLQNLENLYSQMYAKSFLNEIKRDERDFLQGLIDRIDQMIQQLENDDSNSSEGQELIKKNLELLQNLKDQIDQ